MGKKEERFWKSRVTIKSAEELLDKAMKGYKPNPKARVLYKGVLVRGEARVGDVVKVKLSTGNEVITEKFLITEESKSVEAMGRKFRGLAESGLELEFWEVQIV